MSLFKSVVLFLQYIPYPLLNKVELSQHDLQNKNFKHFCFIVLKSPNVINLAVEPLGGAFQKQTFLADMSAKGGYPLVR